MFVAGLRLCIGFWLVKGPADAVAQDPQWAVDAAAFQHSMNVTTAVYVDGVPVETTGYFLAAFVGETLRGVASPTDIGGSQVFFLTVYANTNGESTMFRLYDAAADSVRLAGQALTFQTNAVLGTPGQPYRVDFGDAEAVNDPDNWVVDPSGFGLTMTATVRVGIGGGEALVDGGAVMGAFVGSEVRGRVTATNVTGGASGVRTLFFLTVYANAEGEQVTVRIASPARDTVYAFPAAFMFVANTSLGSPDAPFTVGSIVSTGADGGFDRSGVLSLEVFPNPAADRVHVTWEGPFEDRVRIRVYDIRGREVDDLGEVAVAGGRGEATVRLTGVRGRGYPAGVYFVTLESGGTTAVGRFVVS